MFLIWLIVASWAAPDTAVVDLSRLEDLRPPDAPVAPGEVRAVSRDIVVQWQDERVRVSVTWTLQADGAVAQPWHLTSDSVQVDAVQVGGAAALTWRSQRVVWLAFEGTTTVTLEGWVTDLRRLTLAPAAVGRLTVQAPGRTVSVWSGDRPVPQVDGVWLAPWERLALVVKPEAANTAGALLHAEETTGFSVTDGALVAQTTMLVTPRRGAMQVWSMSVPSAPDLTVALDVPGTWRREGTTLEIHLERPTRDAVVLRLGWSRPLASGEVAEAPLETVGLLGGGAVTRWTLVGAEPDREVVPVWSGGTELSVGELDGPQRNQVSGDVVSVRSGAEGGVVRVYTSEPADMPDVVVDVADWFAALSREGRVLLQGTLTVRNERAAALTVTMPEGLSLVSAEVGGRLVAAAKVGRRWRIGLPRSVESVEGLISFAVQLVVVGDTHVPWALEGTSDWVMPMPVLDAPVAVRRVTAYLPRGAQDRSAVGRDGVVAAFSEGDGLAYGFGAGVDEARADAVWQEALSAYMVNDVDGARARIEALQDMGASHDNVDRLLGNLDVLEGKKEVDTAEAQRVAAQARARADKLAQEQAVVLEESVALAGQGRADEARAKRRQAAKLSMQIAVGDAQHAMAQAEVAQALAQDVEDEVAEGMVAVEDLGDDEDPVETVSVSVAATLTKEFLQRVPSGRSYQTSVPVVASVMDGVMPGGPPPDAARTEPPLQVVATRAGVVVPPLGEAVRHQHLLLAAGADVPLTHRAELFRRTR